MGCKGSRVRIPPPRPKNSTSPVSKDAGLFALDAVCAEANANRRFAAISATRETIHDLADTGTMRRFFALLLAFALLFQMSWAVAATYCEHETSPEATMHFGHHVHVHKSVDAKKNVAGQFAVDDDCSYCNAGHAALIALACAGVAPEATASAAFSSPPLPGSAPARAPDRPQWLRLA